MDSTKYFATHDPYSRSALEAFLDKVNIYRKFYTETGKAAKTQRALQNYYGISSDGTKSSQSVSRGGDQGQLTMAKVNDYRNLIQHQLILITSQRPAGEAKAINSDTKSLHQARIVSSLVEYYLSQVGYEAKFLRATELGLVTDEAFSILDWDATAGDQIRPDPETGKMITTGDPVFRIIPSWNMARDPYLETPEDMKWGIYGFKMNKYDLAAKFPDKAHQIINSSDKSLNKLIFDNADDRDTDQIMVFCLSHDKTEAVPDGRMSMFIPEEILIDGPFMLPEFNIYRFSQNDVVNSSFGYTNNNDLLAIEEITDALHSVVMTNQTTFGVQAILGAKGSGLDHKQLAKGLAYFEVDPAFFDKIQPLNLTKTPPEIFNYIEMLSRKKETLAGINSVVRGDPEGALRSNSGSALALVQAQSLQFNSGGQRSYYQLLSKTCTGLIKILQTFADSERVISITGKVQGEFLKEFRYTKEQIANVSSVVFEMTNPLEKTIGGKQAMAENLLNKGMIKNARQYITVVRTGSFDAFTEDDERDELFIKEENEMLREKQLVRPPAAPENHEEHIQGHMSIIASPLSKQDEQMVQMTLAHIQDHINLWTDLSMTNPALLIATKQKVLPPPPPPPGMMPPPGMLPQPPQGPPNGAPPPHAGNVNQMMGPETPMQHQAGSVKQPLMPKNPLTGERVTFPAA